MNLNLLSLISLQSYKKTVISPNLEASFLK